MDLVKAIDVLLVYIYKQEQVECRVSEVLISVGFEYNSFNSTLIFNKLKEVYYFNLSDLSYGTIKDFLLFPNAAGHEFVKEYKSYSNYLKVIKKEKERQNRLAFQDARGSFLGGLGTIASFIVACIAIGYTYYQDNRQDKINKMLIERLEGLNKLSSSQNGKPTPQQQTQENKDSLGNLKKQ